MLIGIPALLLAVVVLYFVSPNIRHMVSRNVKSISVNDSLVNNTMSTAELSLPSDKVSTKTMPKVTLIGYAWNAAAPWTVANGGINTTEGSLMESAGVSLQIVKQNDLDKIRNAQLLALKEFNENQIYPATGAVGVLIMGDGGPYYTSTTQQQIDKIYGVGKYHVKSVAASGVSYGEDKLIGPVAWKLNPQLLRGALIAAVIGDGDWVVAVNYCAQLGIPVNPDPTTYDKNAANFIQAEESDYIKSASMLVKCQKTNFKYSLKLMKNGKRTNKDTLVGINGCATWFPGDKNVFDVLPGYTDIISTRVYNNQMACSLIIIDEWAKANAAVFENMLAAMYTAGNQIKLYDSWLVKACECNSKVFMLQDGPYWYKAFNSYTGHDANNIEYSIGGTRAFNYADAEQYYGLNGGASRYEAVYTQIAGYLDTLNPMGYKENVSATIPYADAVNLEYLQAIKSKLATGTAYTPKTTTTTTVLAKADYKVNFVTGSAVIDATGLAIVKKIYGANAFSEDTKINIIGHTDNVGDPAFNLSLSIKRAEAVKQALIDLGFSSTRFNIVTGKGDTSPLPGNTNATEAERYQNRRVEITVLNTK